MVCSKCGAENNKNALICIRCGNQLDANGFEKIMENMYGENNQGSVNQLQNSEPIKKENKVYTPATDENKIRKSIKKTSKKRPKWEMMTAVLIMKALLIFTWILVLVSFFEGLKSFGNEAGILIIFPILMITAIPIWAIILGIIIILLFGLVMGFGINGAALNINRGQKPKISDVFLSPFKNFHNILFLWIFNILLNFIIGLILWIPIVNVIIFVLILIALIYFIPTFMVMNIMAVDSEYRCSGPIAFFKDANDLVKGRRIQYYGMLFSFTPWFILSILTCGLLSIWVLPYFALAQTNMYRAWLYEENFEEQPCIKNGIIILLAILLIIGTISLTTYITYKSATNKAKETLENDSFTHNLKMAELGYMKALHNNIELKGSTCVIKSNEINCTNGVVVTNIKETTSGTIVINNHGTASGTLKINGYKCYGDLSTENPCNK